MILQSVKGRAHGVAVESAGIEGAIRYQVNGSISLGYCSRKRIGARAGGARSYFNSPRRRSPNGAPRGSGPVAARPPTKDRAPGACQTTSHWIWVPAAVRGINRTRNDPVAPDLRRSPQGTERKGNPSIGAAARPAPARGSGSPRRRIETDGWPCIRRLPRTAGRP